MLFSTKGRFLACLLVLLSAGFLFLPHQKWFGSSPLLLESIGNSEWLDSYTAGLELARVQQKPMMVYFGADWCAPCDKLEATTFQDPEVLTELKEIVAVKVDGSEMIESISSVFSQYQVYSLPTIAFFVPPDQILISPRITGYIEAGELVKYLQEVRAR